MEKILKTLPQIGMYQLMVAYPIPFIVISIAIFIGELKLFGLI